MHTFIRYVSEIYFQIVLQWSKCSVHPSAQWVLSGCKWSKCSVGAQWVLQWAQVGAQWVLQWAQVGAQWSKCSVGASVGPSGCSVGASVDPSGCSVVQVLSGCQEAKNSQMTQILNGLLSLLYLFCFCFIYCYLVHYNGK